jgi:hypothetical protein
MNTINHDWTKLYLHKHNHLNHKGIENSAHGVLYSVYEYSKLKALSSSLSVPR